MRPLFESLARQIRRLPVWAVYLLGGLPLLWVVWLTFSNGLGADPVREIEHRLGKIGLWFLLGGLTLSPLRKIGLNLILYRRAIGLLAFFYIGLHLCAWLLLDMGLLWAQAAGDLFKRPYLFFGFASLLLLLPLALTSNTAAIRALGRNWRRLHILVYPAAGLAVLHYLWQMKIVTGEGWVWLAVLLFLLGLRLWPKGASRIRPESQRRIGKNG